VSFLDRCSTLLSFRRRSWFAPRFFSATADSRPSGRKSKIASQVTDAVSGGISLDTGTGGLVAIEILEPQIWMLGVRDPITRFQADACYSCFALNKFSIKLDGHPTAGRRAGRN
jgi:hypothetical protein